MIKTLTKHGNSYALVIDKPILDLLNIRLDRRDYSPLPIPPPIRPIPSCKPTAILITCATLIGFHFTLRNHEKI